MELQQTVTIMSKIAEEAALKAYPPKRKEVSMSGCVYTVVGGDFERRIYQQGYEQAEKDLALTWEDVQLLDFYAMECQVEESNGRKFNSSQEFFEEVLRRFNKTKEEKK